MSGLTLARALVGASLLSVVVATSCSSEVVVDGPSGGGGGGGAGEAGGAGGGAPFDCDAMCDQWIAKFPQCMEASCLGFCRDKLEEGQATGCLPEAVACLERILIDATDCGGGCNNWQAYIDCTQL